MANISLTYTLSNGTTADADQVMQDLNDIVNGTSDGTKDFSINALTAAGTASLNGAVNLGNATSDDITITGRIASDIDPKTAATYTLGDATQTWRSLSLDNTTNDGGAIYFDAGTTKFIKSDASGADLDVSGFTSFDFNGINLKGTGDIAPSSTAAEDLGTTALTFRALYLDNAATDGGAIYFDAGTTAFLKSSTDHADLDLGGFTNFDFNAINLKGTGDIAPGTTAAEDIGTSSLTYRHVHLDNGATNGGAILFNASSATSTSTILASSDGTKLTTNFTQVNLSGQCLVGSSGTAQRSLHVDGLTSNAAYLYSDIAAGSSPLLIGKSNDSSTSSDYVAFYRGADLNPASGTLEGTISTDGSGNFAFTNTSDRRIKKNIKPVTSMLERIERVNVVEYELKGDARKKKHKGVVAQELAEIFPDKIAEAPDDGLGDDLPENGKPWRISTNWTYELLAAVKELSARLKIVESRLDEIA